jgi:D-aspartate ligase
MTATQLSPASQPRTSAPESVDGVGALVVGGDYQGLGIARSLGERGIPVVVLDDERSIAASSRFVKRRRRVPNLRDPRSALDALLDTHRQLGLSGWVLYPTREETVATIAAHQEELTSRFRVPTPATASVGPAWDKRQTYRLAESLGIATPRCWFPTSEAALAEVDLSTPVVVKPAIKERFFYEAKVKAWRADSPEELLAAYRRAAAITEPDEVIIQELIRGGGDCQFAYCALFKEGHAIADMTVRRRRQHPSDFGRASTFVETIEPNELTELSARFLRAIGYYGLVELEYKRDPRDGRFKLLDVNARTWGYHTLGRAAGVDFPYLLFRDQLGLSVPPTEARPGVRWIRLITDLPNAARDVARGLAAPGAYLRSLRGIHTEAVFSLRDPIPGLYELVLAPYLARKRGL